MTATRMTKVRFGNEVSNVDIKKKFQGSTQPKGWIPQRKGEVLVGREPRPKVGLSIENSTHLSKGDPLTIAMNIVGLTKEAVTKEVAQQSRTRRKSMSISRNKQKFPKRSWLLKRQSIVSGLQSL